MIAPAIASLFDRAVTDLHRVVGGQALYAAGDDAVSLFMVRAGAFAVFRADDNGRRLVGIVRRGEIVGEAALLAGTQRSATVVALRDSEVAVLRGDALFAAAREQPEIMAELARLLIVRARGADIAPPYAPPRIIALAALTPGVRALDWARTLAAAIGAQGRSAIVLDRSAGAQPPSWWSRIEDAHDLVLCAAEHGEDDWSAICRRQADRMILLAHAEDAPPADCGLCQSEPLQANGLVDLLLVHRRSQPHDSPRWLDAIAPANLFHVAQTSDCARLARGLTGTGVALALSGGGARAFAHIGAVQALRRAGIAIDAVGGTSMGAIVAGGVAAGWDDAELDARMRAAFVTSNPLDDIALPFVAMTRGHKVDRRLAEHFGEWDIADLPLPYFCVSADLAAGSQVVHRRGSLATALRASIALPGILPPVALDGQVLVDGGTLVNLPTTLMRGGHEGSIVAVDVSRSLGLMAGDVERPRPLGRWFWSGAWRRGPPIVSILMRSATIAAEPELRAARAAADLYVMPELGGIEIRNWRAYDRAVEAGDIAMTAALEALTVPLADLRAHRQRAVAAVPM